MSYLISILFETRLIAEPWSNSHWGIVVDRQLRVTLSAEAVMGKNRKVGRKMRNGDNSNF